MIYPLGFYYLIFVGTGIFEPFGHVSTSNIVTHIFYLTILLIVGNHFFKHIYRAKRVYTRDSVLTKMLFLIIAVYFVWKIILVLPYFRSGILAREFVSKHKPHILNSLDLLLFQSLYAFLKVYVYTWILFSRRWSYTVFLALLGFFLSFITMLSRSELLNILFLLVPFLRVNSFKSVLRYALYVPLLLLLIASLRPNLSLLMSLKYAGSNLIAYNAYPIYLYDTIVDSWPISTLLLAGVCGYPFVKFFNLWGLDIFPNYKFYTNFEYLGEFNGIPAAANVLYNTPAHFQGVFGFIFLVFYAVFTAYLILKFYRSKIFTLSATLFVSLFLYSPKRHLLVVPEFWIMIIVSILCIPFFYATKYSDNHI